MARINRTIELLAEGQPVYYGAPSERTYAGGRADAATFADYIQYDLEYHPLDLGALGDYMRGMVAAGTTRSGHRTPTVVVGVPFTGSDEQTVRSNSWIVRHILATGVHGLIMPHAESPEAARAFVQAARFPLNRRGAERPGAACRASAVPRRRARSSA